MPVKWLLPKRTILFGALPLAFLAFIFFLITYPLKSSEKPPAAPLLSLHDLDTSGGMVIFSESGHATESYWGLAARGQQHPIEASTTFNLGSMSKQFTGYLILLLEQENRLNTETLLQVVLPEIRNTALASITVRQLLEMTSGLPTNEPWYTKIGMQIARRNWVPAEIISEIKSYDLSFKPGERIQYSNLGYVLLGLIVDRIEGKPLSEVLAERIFWPFGMSQTYLDVPPREVTNLARGYFFALDRWIPLPNWNYSFLQGAGGMISNVRDLTKWNSHLTRFFEQYPNLRQQYFGLKSKRGYSYGWSTNGNIAKHSGETPGFCSYVSRSTTSRAFAVLTLNSDICLSTDRWTRVESEVDAWVRRDQ